MLKPWASPSSKQSEIKKMTGSILIKNGRVIDGTGNPWYKADVFLTNGLITDIGEKGPEDGDYIIDAKGMAVTPGFIDTHTHSDGTMFIDPLVQSSVHQGVTTQVIGNCGCGFAPINPARKTELERYVRRLLPIDIDATWLTFREYFREMSSIGFSTNIVPLITHGAIRIAVMGFENREPTPGELGQMKLLVSEGMEAGASGFSTGLIYPPCIYAKTQEIIELCNIVSRFDGIFVIHIRGEGETLIPAVQEALEIAEKSEIRTHISHHKATGIKNWGKTETTLRFIEQSREAGVELTFDQYPYIAGATVLVTFLPSWTHEGGLDQLLQRLRDPETRESIRQEMEGEASGPEKGVFNERWEDVYVSVVKTEDNKKYEGKNLTEIKELRGDPDEYITLFDLLLEEGGEVRMVTFSQNEDEMRKVMRHPLHMVGSDGRSVSPTGPLSQGKPHPRFYGTFPRILGKYVREEGVLTLEDAVRRITSYPAQTFRIRNKGLLRKGMDADIVVFNPDTIIDRATYQDPHNFPDGIEYVIVNGVPVIEKGRHTGVTPGEIIRHNSKMKY
jgi:N-acyl-D-aspartate/D-glutamate deacylase